MALQDDRDRIAARNDATRPPMVQAVFGGPTNKKSQLQKQIDAERAARPAVSSVTPASVRPAAVATARENPAVRPLKQAAAAAGQAIGNTADNIGLYVPKNARDVGVNLRRASAVPLIAAEVATRPVRAGLGAVASGAADVVGGLFSGEQSPAPQEAPAAPAVAGRPGTGAPSAFQNVAAGSSSVSADPTRRARDDQFLAQDFVAGNKADRSNALNINRPVAIPGTDMQYAGQYGDTAVIERPGAKGERSFSDTDGVAGTNQGARPAVAGAEPQLSPAEQYIKNPTMSDGPRVFGSGVGAPTGGPNANERLQQARLAAIARGDGAVVEKQLAEEGMTPAQRNAYRADPLKAYEIDQVTKAENAKAESIGMKNYRDDILKRAGLGLQADKAAQGKTSAFSKRLVDTAKLSFPDGDLEVDNPGAMREILSAILAKKVGPDGADFEQIAAQEATKLRAAAQAEGFDPGAYLAQYMEAGSGEDYSATDEVMGF